MCSTPRFSAKPRSIHKLSGNTCSYQSYSQMLRIASQRYEQRQQDLGKKRAELVQKEKEEMVEDEQNTMTLDIEAINEGMVVALEEAEIGFFKRLFLRLSCFMGRRPTRIYHEHR